MTIRVVIADDHRVVRDGLCYLLSQEPDIEVAGEAGDGPQTVDVVAATRPDVLLLDLYMPGLDGHAVLAALNDTPHDKPGRPADDRLAQGVTEETQRRHLGCRSPEPGLRLDWPRRQWAPAGVGCRAVAHGEQLDHPHPVRQHVVELEQVGRLATLETLDQRGLPGRPVAIERPGCQLSSQV